MKTDQSNGNLGLELDGVEINIIHMTMPLPGSGCSRLGGCCDRLFISLAVWLQTKQCAITIIDNNANGDVLCLGRALVVAIAYYLSEELGLTQDEKFR